MAASVAGWLDAGTLSVGCSTVKTEVFPCRGAGEVYRRYAWPGRARPALRGAEHDATGGLTAETSQSPVPQRLFPHSL